MIKLKINPYILFIITTFISVSFLMEYFSRKKSFDGFLIALPIIILLVFWCKNSSGLIRKNEYQLSKIQIFKRDMFLIFYSFISADLIYLLFQYNNIDRGWWPLSLYSIGFIGLIFAAFFSFIALMIENHKSYSIVFSLIIFFAMIASGFWPHKFDIIFTGPVDTYLLIIYLLALIHFLICFTYFLIASLNK